MTASPKSTPPPFPDRACSPRIHWCSGSSPLQPMVGEGGLAAALAADRAGQATLESGT